MAMGALGHVLGERVVVDDIALVAFRGAGSAQHGLDCAERFADQGDTALARGHQFPAPVEQVRQCRGGQRLAGHGQGGGEWGQDLVKVADAQATKQFLVVGIEARRQRLAGVEDSVFVVEDVVDDVFDIERQPLGQARDLVDKGVGDALALLCVLAEQFLAQRADALHEHGADVVGAHGRQTLGEDAPRTGGGEGLGQALLGSVGAEPGQVGALDAQWEVMDEAAVALGDLVQSVEEEQHPPGTRGLARGRGPLGEAREQGLEALQRLGGLAVAVRLRAVGRRQRGLDALAGEAQEGLAGAAQGIVGAELVAEDQGVRGRVGDQLGGQGGDQVGLAHAGGAVEPEDAVRGRGNGASQGVEFPLAPDQALGEGAKAVLEALDAEPLAVLGPWRLGRPEQGEEALGGGLVRLALDDVGLAERPVVQVDLAAADIDLGQGRVGGVGAVLGVARDAEQGQWPERDDPLAAQRDHRILGREGGVDGGGWRRGQGRGRGVGSAQVAIARGGAHRQVQVGEPGECRPQGLEGCLPVLEQPGGLAVGDAAVGKLDAQGQEGPLDGARAGGTIQHGGEGLRDGRRELRQCGVRGLRVGDLASDVLGHLLGHAPPVAQRRQFDDLVEVAAQVVGELAPQPAQLAYT